MKRVVSICDWCGVEFEKYEHELHQHNFCCRAHLQLWNRKRISEYNKNENPMNFPCGGINNKGDAVASVKDTVEWHEAHRRKRLSEKPKAYRKYYGRHEHRVVAERILGRPLLRGEVVHHVDGDKSNNDPLNLVVFASQSDHARLHMRKRKGGDAQ